MEFKDYVKSLPNERETTILELAKLCRVSRQTVYRWLQGEFLPDPLKRRVIAEYLGKEEKELFPNV
ncbi:helix-turn-helix transcriptional regulator [Prevotella nigrescens]|uniref:helix-turn-helix transcriptional regulator n=1 Tax=Prevotella nigrescens TaxID=28133 RepID=UPI00241D3348|nr:helix-turn-helix transcriptional regulator [Prevotella nigrescens]